MKNKGMTMIEIIIVLALITIVSAVILPNFINSTSKAQLSSDIYSARVIQSAMDIYNVEQPSNISTTNINDTIKELYEKGYLKQQTYVTQTTNGKFVYANDLIKVDINSASDKVKEAYGKLSDNDKQFVVVSTP